MIGVLIRRGDLDTECIEGRTCEDTERGWPLTTRQGERPQKTETMLRP